MTSTNDLLSCRPERLVVTGFRNIMAACELGDMACWEAVWQNYITELGAEPARSTVGELQYWTRSVRRHAERPLSYYPQCCRYLCHDECMALSIIAAAQSEDEPTGLLAVRYLTGQNCPDRLWDVWHSAQPFARAMSHAGQHLLSVTSDVVESIFHMQQKMNRRSPCLHLN